MLSTLNGRDATVAALAVAAAVSGGYYALKWQQKRREAIPSESDWKKIGNLRELACYPIKSCGMVKQDSMFCSVLGLSNGYLRDRTFLIINSDENMESARTHPQLVLVQPKIVDDYLILSGPNMEDLKLRISALEENSKATVWGQVLPVADCGDEASNWISRYLDRPGGDYRLVYYPHNETQRNLRENRPFPLMKKEDLGAFCDLTSFCLINDASVADLNKHLMAEGSTPVDALVFRGNFVVFCEEPFAEDNWGWVKIGDAVFRGVAPCSRCIMTTLNYTNGTKKPDREPLKTLKKYRCLHGPAPTMGLHLAIRKEGSVKIGDDVYVV